MRWFVGQWEVRPATPGCNEQCGLSEIGGRYFWSDVRGCMLIIRLGISTDHGARSFTPGTTCALITVDCAAEMVTSPVMPRAASRRGTRERPESITARTPGTVREDSAMEVETTIRGVSEGLSA